MHWLSLVCSLLAPCPLWQSRHRSARAAKWRRSADAADRSKRRYYSTPYSLACSVPTGESSVIFRPHSPSLFGSDPTGGRMGRRPCWEPALARRPDLPLQSPEKGRAGPSQSPPAQTQPDRRASALSPDRGEPDRRALPSPEELAETSVRIISPTVTVEQARRALTLLPPSLERGFAQRHRRYSVDSAAKQIRASYRAIKPQKRGGEQGLCPMAVPKIPPERSKVLAASCSEAKETESSAKNSTAAICKQAILKFAKGARASKRRAKRDTARRR